MNQPTVINKQTTNITHNTKNVNQWFQGDSWRERATINSRNWNGRPWWYRPDYGDWHHGHWHGEYYFRGRDAWRYVDSSDHQWLNGLVAWGLGNLIYRSGYQAYSNPFYLQPVRIGSTVIDYSRPICVLRSQYELAYANDEAKAQLIRNQALGYFGIARGAFFARDAAKAYENVNRAIALMPDDTSLHEFRALVLFSVGRYREAAEVIHAVLAVAPGWDWTTLSGLYRDNDIYQSQLRALEEHVSRNPREADARFLLAYHYITTGYPESAKDQLRATLVLDPKDRLSADLLALVEEGEAQDPPPVVAGDGAIRAADFEGDWKARRPEGEIELELLQDGTFKWDYDFTNNDEILRGKFMLAQDKLFFATQDGSQMIGAVNMRDLNHFTFRLLGTGASDPGLEFVRR